MAFSHRIIVKPHSCGEEIVANPEKENMSASALASVNLILH